MLNIERKIERRLVPVTRAHLMMAAMNVEIFDSRRGQNYKCWRQISLRGFSEKKFSDRMNAGEISSRGERFESG